ncbi:alpha-glucosidase [Clostridium sp. LBM24168]
MRIRDKENGFSLLIDEKELITHSIQNPCIYVGKGKADYNMFRGNFDIKDHIFEKIALNEFNLVEDNNGVTITFFRKNIYSLKVKFYEDKGRSIIEFLENPYKFNRLWIRIKAESGEHVYGCGEQFSYFDLRGRNYPLWTSEQGIGRNKSTYVTFLADSMGKSGGDYYTTFFPEPTFISSRKYYCHVDGSSYMDFDFSNSNFHELQIWDVPKRIIFESGENYLELIMKLTGFLGRQPELPEWVYNGVWLGIQGGTDVVLGKLKDALEKGVKVSGIWAQDWEGIRITSFGKRLMWNWTWDKNLYPDLDKIIKELKQKGIGFLGYINPYLAVEGSLFKEASKNGYLAKDKDGKDYLVEFGEFYAGIVDFTMPEACRWYKSLIKREMIDLGLSGWMADFGEYLPADVVLKNGMSPEIMHNVWPAMWARINREAVEESGKINDIVFFMRSGSTGSQKYSTMIWAGDQNVNWSLDDGLASVIPAALSLGMTGYGLHHSDIGGYTTLFEMKRTKELFMRWAEMAAFTPIMRTHEGNRPEDNWQFDSDDETICHFAKMSRVYSSLAEYTKSIVKENSQKGIPLQRPLFMHYENDEKCYTIKYEYLYGRDILVAPVYKPGKRMWKLYLPEDNWVHLWTGKEYEGGEISIQVPIGQPSVFYRKNSEYKDLFKKIGNIEYGGF